MTRKRTVTRLTAEVNPTIQIKFTGKYKADYFSLHRIGQDCHDTTGTNYARQILHDFLKRYQGETEVGKARLIQQMNLNLKMDASRQSAQGAEKRNG